MTQKSAKGIYLIKSKSRWNSTI